MNEFEWSEEQSTCVKKALNNLIWMHSPDNLTLKEAEERALLIFDLLRTPPKQESGKVKDE